MIRGKRVKRQSSSGFTLVELLVVISIILIVSSVIFLGSGGGEGAKLSSSQRIISGIAQGARGQAILKNAPTRLIIYSDDSSNEEDEKKLRFFGIVYWGDEVDTDGTVVATGWKAATQGTSLPEGIYFNPDLGDNSTAIPTMNLDYPRLRVGANTDRVNGGGSDEFFFYEFKSNGTVATASPNTKSFNFVNSWLAIQAGVLKPNGADGSLEVSFPADDPSLESLTNLKSALIFRRVGTTTNVVEPADIR